MLEGMAVMRILVTGGAGFLRFHVVDLLLQEKHQVCVVDNLPTGFTSNLRPEALFVHRDVRQPLEPLFTNFRPEVVIHLAAQISVPDSIKDPYKGLAINARGIVNVMTAAAATGMRKVVAVSSAALYGIPRSIPTTEETPTLSGLTIRPI